MDYILETQRLRLRQFNADDAGFIVKLLNTKGWLDFIGDKYVHNEDQAVAYLDSGPISSYKKHGFGVLLVELKEGAVPIGMCGLLKRDSLPDPDIGFAFLPEYEGKGYALESAMATLRYASENLQIVKISAITKADNRKSIRLLQGLGFRFISKITFSGADEGLLLYSNEDAIVV
jgi:RimJ/RimL family protein N-acetyltransferase